jgi:hypothetical protein
MEEIVESQEIVLKKYKKYGNLCKSLLSKLNYVNIADVDYISDYGRRIFFDNLDGYEYCVRLWDIDQSNNILKIRYSIFKKVINE